MKLAIGVTGCCLMLVLLGVFAVLSNPRHVVDTTITWDEDTATCHFLNGEHWRTCEDEIPVKVLTDEPPIVWIANQEAVSSAVNCLTYDKETGVYIPQPCFSEHSDVQDAAYDLGWEHGKNAAKAAFAQVDVRSDTPDFQFTKTGVLKIDKASLDRLLSEYPESKMRVAVYQFDRQTHDWEPVEPTPAEAVAWIHKVMAGTVTCLDKMEAAMRAMDDIVEGQQLGIDGTHDKQWVSRLQLWRDVKRQCWKEQP